MLCLYTGRSIGDLNELPVRNLFRNGTIDFFKNSTGMIEDKGLRSDILYVFF